MNRNPSFFVIALAIILLLVSAGWATPLQLSNGGFENLAGIWAGTLQAGGNLRLVLHFEQSQGQWQVTLDSIDQGAMGLKVKNLVLDGDQISFELANIPASYSGTIVDADHIKGTWKQGMELPLSFERTNEVPELKRPQQPAGPFPYTEEEVVYSFNPDDIPATLVPKAAEGDAGLITLRGTLTLPPGSGPHPAVLLITGSGPQDRNETIMNHQPFLVLADYLSRRGLAVLRVDDRGTGQSTGDFAQATTEDFAKDAAAGFLFLQQRSDIARDRVALLGHSEGGLIAPMVAVDYSEVAAIVLMAGPGVDGQEVLRLQLRLMLQVQGVSDELVDKTQAQQQELFEILGGKLEGDEYSARLEALFTGRYEALTPAEKSAMGTLDSYLKTAKAQVDSPWMRWFLTFDPAPTLSRVACPVLALNGAKDLQVDADQNLPAIAAALEAGGAKDFQTVKLPELNHLFQHCQTGAVTEYGQIEETLAPELLEAVTKWLQERLTMAER